METQLASPFSSLSLSLPPSLHVSLFLSTSPSLSQIWVKSDATTCLNGTDMRDNDLRDFNVESREECESRCLADPQCQAWVVDECSKDYPSPHCWLKSTDKAAQQTGQSCRCLGLVGEHKPKDVDVPAQVQRYVGEYVWEKKRSETRSSRRHATPSPYSPSLPPSLRV